MPVKYIIMPVTLTICACMGFALEICKSCTNKLCVCAGHKHNTILPDRFSQKLPQKSRNFIENLISSLQDWLKLIGKPFEDPFENTHQRKVKQMQ